jgi:hypothetical protein
VCDIENRINVSVDKTFIDYEIHEDNDIPSSGLSCETLFYVIYQKII